MPDALLPDETIHQSVRLRIMATLRPLGEPIEFPRLRALLGITDGNLGAHLTTLEQAGYVSVQKDFNGRRPRTRVEMTRQGRAAFARHVAYLRDLLEEDQARS